MAEFVKVQGLAELKRAMAEIPVAMQGKVALELLRKAGKPMLDDARARAPARTGKLRKNIYLARARDSTQQSPLIVIRVRRRGKAGDPKNAYYWLFQELGTSKMAARPFLRPAFESKKGEALTILRTATAEQVEKAARKVAKYTARFARR